MKFTQPSLPILDGYPAVSTGVPKQGDHEHRRAERQADGLKPEPVRIDLIVEHRPWSVGGIGAVVRELDPRTGMPVGLVLATVDVDLSLREVWQTPGMVEVQVGQHDVPDGLGADAEAGELAYGRRLRVAPQPKVQGE